MKSNETNDVSTDEITTVTPYNISNGVFVLQESHERMISGLNVVMDFSDLQNFSSFLSG